MNILTSSKSLMTEQDVALAKKHGYGYGMIYNNIVLPAYVTTASYELSRTFATRKGDICIASYPKSGTTWLLYTIVLLTHQNNPINAKNIEGSYLWPTFSFGKSVSAEQLEAASSPRIFKSHMPYPMVLGEALTSNPCKYVYIARHPKDVIVSTFHFSKNVGNYNGTWDYWFSLFVEGKMRFGDWFDHLKGWWEQQTEDNILVIWYKDLKEDFPSVLQKVAEFLDYPLSIELKEQIEEKTSFKEMKNSDFTKMKWDKNFYRKGKVGTGKEQFTEAQNEQFDAWCRQRLEETGLLYEREVYEHLFPNNNK